MFRSARPARRKGRLLLLPLALLVLAGCQNLNRFDTKGGQAYCGSLVSGAFIRTDPLQGGFDRYVGLTVEIDTSKLTTTPVVFTSNGDDSNDGENPCRVAATDGGVHYLKMFDHAPLRVTPEVVSDTLSTMMFEDGQVQNIVGWVDSACRGTMLAVVSLYKNDRVEARFLRSANASPPALPNERDRDAFALFALTRDEHCP